MELMPSREHSPEQSCRQCREAENSRNWARDGLRPETLLPHPTQRSPLFWIWVVTASFLSHSS